MNIANIFLAQHRQIFKLLLMPTPVHRILFMLSLCCLALVPIAILLNAYEFSFLLACAIFSWSIFGFLVFHGQICALANNPQLRFLPGIKQKVLQQFFVAVIVVALLLWLGEWLLLRVSVLGFAGALVISFFANSLLLLVARLWPIMLPICWLFLALKFDVWRALAMQHTALLLVVAAVGVPVLIIFWNKLLPSHSYHNPVLSLVDGAPYWQLFYQRYLAFFNLLHWSARSLQGSVLAGRADNPWRYFWLWFLSLLFAAITGAAIKMSDEWLQKALVDYGVAVIFAGYMLDASGRVAVQFYSNLGRLWLNFSGDRIALLRHLELRSARLLWLKGIAGSAVVLVLLALLQPALLAHVEFWLHACALLVCLWFLQAILFYASLFIYCRTEADKVWLSTFISITVMALIFIAVFSFGLVANQVLSLNVLWLLVQTCLLLIAGYWRMRVYQVWGKCALVKRGAHV
ncbi:MAG TPA: hypothetical protein VLC79_02385 [Cellvibrio sp.]|nr:hypothetical protein [Cellvibrio sp.]